MKRIDFYLDFISPYAYLAFERWPQALMGIDHHVVFKPVLLGALLRHHGQLGPAEIAPKRDWTYRQVQWRAREWQIPLDLPAIHPFNPLPLLRLALACSPEGQHGQNGMVNRHVCEHIFRHVWQGGQDAADPARIQALTEQLPVQRDPGSEAIKTELKNQTQEAIERGIFGVPSFCVDDKNFWGQDALDMLKACLQQDPWFDGPAWR